MNATHLRFACQDPEWGVPEIVDLIASDPEADIPDKPGAYVIGTGDGTTLTYPWGTSPVFYIGSTVSLRGRLGYHHRSGILSVAENPWQVTEYRFQYGVAFGAHVTWFERGGAGEARQHEAWLLQRFYWSFGSIPTANSRWEELPSNDQG